MTTLSYKPKRTSSFTITARVALKVLSSTSRYSIMRLLLAEKEDFCVHEIADAIGISQSATSHQLAYLEAHGIVKSIRMGKTKCYVPTDSVLTKKVGDVIKTLQ